MHCRLHLVQEHESLPSDFLIQAHSNPLPLCFKSESIRRG